MEKSQINGNGGSLEKSTNGPRVPELITSEYQLEKSSPWVGGRGRGRGRVNVEEPVVSPVPLTPNEISVEAQLGRERGRAYPPPLTQLVSLADGIEPPAEPDPFLETIQSSTPSRSPEKFTSGAQVPEQQLQKPWGVGRGRGRSRIDIEELGTSPVSLTPNVNPEIQLGRGQGFAASADDITIELPTEPNFPLDTSSSTLSSTLSLTISSTSSSTSSVSPEKSTDALQDSLSQQQQQKLSPWGLGRGRARGRQGWGESGSITVPLEKNYLSSQSLLQSLLSNDGSLSSTESNEEAPWQHVSSRGRGRSPRPPALVSVDNIEPPAQSHPLKGKETTPSSTRPGSPEKSSISPQVAQQQLHKLCPWGAGRTRGRGQSDMEDSGLSLHDKDNLSSKSLDSSFGSSGSTSQSESSTEVLLGRGRGRGRGHATNSPPPSPPSQTPASPVLLPIHSTFNIIEPPAEPNPPVVEVSKKIIPHSVIPQRKSKGDVVGRKGVQMPLEVNHMALHIKNPQIYAIHYDVAFKPDSPKRLFRLIMQTFQRKMYPNNFPAFDGRKNLYSCGYLPGGVLLMGTVKVRNDEKQDDVEYEVTVKFAAKVDMSPLIQYMNRGSSISPPQEALQAIDIVLRSPSSMRFVGVGRSFFTAPLDGKTTIDLGDGLELWYGFYQSAILGWKPFLNVDIAHKGFPKAENLIKVIMNLTGLQERDLQRELEPVKKDFFQRFVNGLKIEYEIPKQPQSKHVYKINKVMGSSFKERFVYEKDGKKDEITVEEYFEKYKAYRLIFPRMPCIHVGPAQKSIFVPIELCKIAKGQALMKKLNEKQTASMVRNAAQPADLRKRKILDAMKIANFNQDRTVQEFGISVSDNFTAVKGRVLDPPTLKYNAVEILPEKGVWRSKQFLVSQSLNNWCILKCEDRTRTQALLKFAQELERIGRDHGCKINPHPCIKEINKRSIYRDDIAEKLSQCKKEHSELVVVIIPNSGSVYGRVKQAAELDIGILTQCIKAATLAQKLSPTTITNILLKMNAKLNGVNHTIGGVQRPMVLKKPVMIVGADVTHPSPEQMRIPSVAAVAASHDPKAFQYNMLWRLQPPRTEIIVDLENIMKAQLMFFYKRTNGYKPERIFFYRDGVSEGQFLEVLNKELKAIRRACTVLEVDYKPKITFLVVQKRHHTRFFPTRHEDEDGKNKNVPAGTIVDTTITHPTEFDFYLVSHASIQGTSRPTKYHLLWDDNEMDEDDLEELTYYLCHLFSRCTRSVSYPAPTYYAHLAAFRARVYLEGNDRINLSKLTFEQEKRKIMSNVIDESPMFFI